MGYAPVLAPFAQLPGWTGQPEPAAETRFSAEVGLFWAIDPDVQGRGYATEAGRALIAHGLAQLHLARIVATTEHDNLASQRVMEKLGMHLERNPLPNPPWLQVVGIVAAPDG